MSLVTVDPACWRAAQLPANKIRHYARLAERATADGLLVFRTDLAFYAARRDLFEGCTGPAPTDAAVAAVRAMEPAAVVSVPYADWPMWAKLVAKRRKAGEVGVGETFERHAAAVGGKIFERAMKKLGANCGCRARRAKWDKQFRYVDISAL